MLISIVVITFLSRTMLERQSANNSLNQSKVDELAQSALDIITSDLKQEIVNGSTVVAPASGNTSYPPIYQPSNNAYVIPMQNWPGQPTAGMASTIPNLIRISSTTAIALPGVDHPASAVLSTTASANGRSVSLARWNQHYLIPCPANPPDSTPSSTCNFTAPSWAYVTASGPSVITASNMTSTSSPVIGRYAYAVYNEGGLLDVNVAGYPSNQTPAQIGPKSGSLAYADLTQLVDPAGTPCLTTGQIDQIVGWRNNASAQPSGNFPSFNFSGSNPTKYLTYVASSTNSFMTVSGNNGIAGAAWNGNTDQAFINRQELINLQSSIGFPASALQFLGTFSREVNAPTFNYPAPGTATFTNAQYKATPINDPVANSTNVNILSLRMSQAGTAIDGFTWNAGDLLVCRRFPLGRLALVAYNATNTSTSSTIYKYFGLYRSVWTSPNASQSAWIYTGSSGSTTAASSIESLGQVAAETPSREPNFFELLKAAIHSDSIGVSDGFYNKSNSTNTMTGNVDSIDNLTDLQILRIGANMIDQADADSYPTVIGYNPTGTTMLYAYGVEDLPYVSALAFRGVADSYWKSGYVDPGATARQERDEIIPVIWNPHRTINATTNVPAQIQLYMTGKTYYTLDGGQSGTGGVTSTYNDTLNYGSSTSSSRYNEIALTSSSLTGPSSGQNTGSITINTSQFPLTNFANPSFIPYATGVTATGAYATTGSTAGGNAPALPNHTTGQTWAGSAKIYGLMLQNPVFSQGRQVIPAQDFSGSFTRFDGYWSCTATGGGGIHHFLGPGVAGVGLNVVLRYMDAGGNWQVYNAMGCNEADPNGNIYTNYDAFGVVTASTSTTSGIYLAPFSTPWFPPFYQTAANYTTQWANSGGTLPNSSYPAMGVGKDLEPNNTDGNYMLIMKSDPRTGRFGLSDEYNVNYTTDFVRDPSLTMTEYGSASANGFTMRGYVPTANIYRMTVNSGTYYPGMWAQNSLSNPNGSYYYDYSASGGLQSGIVRPGDDYLNGASGLPNTSGTTATNNIYEATDARPVVLNRPFRNVGELGYVFRDMPFKSLDMSSSVSVDAALLDFFTVDSALTPLVAGKVDLNTRQASVLQCVLNGSSRMGDPSGPAGMVSMGPNAAKTIAANIVAVTNAVAGSTTGPSSTGPLMNKAELVTRMGCAPNSPNITSTVFDSNPFSSNPSAGTYPATATDTPSSTPASLYPSIKSQREAPVRALADVVNSRTWNLLIDVIAQTGQYPAGATGLSQFVVTGERRYWLHVAIDRYTGQVVDQQLEPVYE